jgi:hypothetical protein
MTKAAETKPAAATAAKNNQPFFNKGGGSSMSFVEETIPSFFTGSPGMIQSKLSVGHPDDKYEQEADRVADQVVRLPTKPINIQAKCAACEEEELQKREEEQTEEVLPEIQKNTITEAVPEPAASDSTDNTPPLSSNFSPAPVQLKCAACEEEEIQEKEKQGEEEAIQTKLTIGASGDPYEKEADAVADKVVQRLQLKPALNQPAENIQRSSCRECDEGEYVFRKPVVSSFLQLDGEPALRADGSRDSIIAAAKTMLGKIEARNNDGAGKRVGANYLLEIFHLAAPGVWDDSIIETAGTAMPSWCGIFSVWAHKKAGKDIGSWQMGRGVSAFRTLTQTTNPQPGDIGYIDQPYQHHCIIVKVEGDTVFSIDGNSGNYSEVIENRRPVTAYSGFFTAFSQGSSVQRKAESNSTAPSSIENRLSTSRGRGSALPEDTRRNMESFMGADFSEVKIHTDSNAVQMSKDLHAQAFTNGSDIYFNSGKFDTSSTKGQHLLAHELTHTVQQGAAGVQKKPVPEIQKNGDPIADAADAVYNALDGWTDSDDSALIWSHFRNKDKTATDSIISSVASKQGYTVYDTIDWMYSDLVTSDWNRLFGHLVTINANRADHLVAQQVYSYLSGYTSTSNSNSILAIYRMGSGVTGDLLGRSLTELESVTGYTRNDTITYLFGDLTNLDAHNLSLHFFGSGNSKAIGYAAHWIASKIYDLLSGYTSSSDSTDIVNNFTRVPEGLRSVVLYELDILTLAAWEQTASAALMEDMWQSDYEQLRILMPGLLPVYNIELNWLEWTWDKLTVGYDILEGLAEYLVCGLIGIIWGIITIIIDIVVAVVDIVIAIKDILGLVIYFITGGMFCRENKERVWNFFSAIGQMFNAPGDAIGSMWNEITAEASLIEGPFKQCQQAIYWVSRVTNLIVNLLLIFAWGYGAVKTALKGIEAIIAMARAGELIAALEALPARLLASIKNLPSTVAKAILTSSSKVIGLLKNPVEIIAAARNTLSAIRMAAGDQGYYTFLRRQMGYIVEGESAFWRERRAFWQQRAGEIETGIVTTEGKLILAVEGTAEDAAKAETLLTQAESEALTHRNSTNTLMDDVHHGGVADEPGNPRVVPGSPASQRLALDWERGLNAETRALLDADPDMRRFWHEMDPAIRSALTYCNTPCIPLGVSQQNIQLIGQLMHRLQIPSDHRGLREYLHMFRNSDAELENAIRALNSINTLQDLNAFFDNELIKYIQKAHGVTIRRGAGGLWEYPRADGSVVREFEIHTHSFLTNNRGTDSFLQSHHGIQDAWAQQRFAGLGVYSREEAKALLLRSRNMNGGSRGTPHGLINDLQRGRSGSIGTRTFLDERANLVSDMNIIGVPQAVQVQYLAEVDAYFGNIYTILSNRLTPQQLQAIFGTWHP